jgi:hypothetical protein
MSDLTPAGYMPSYSGDLRICRNPKCRLVYRPDPIQWVESEKFCPKCGTELCPEDPETADNQDVIGTHGYF